MSAVSSPLEKANTLTWTIATLAADFPAGTVFAAAFCAIAGIRLSQELFGCRLALCSRGGAYDPRGILSLHARHWLFNRAPRAHVNLQEVFDTMSAPHALFATPGQVDADANANLSCIGEHDHPKVAFGGTRGLPDARTIHFVMPSYSNRQLVKKVSFISTCAATRQTPAMLITEDCVLRWNHGRSIWALEAVVPGVEASNVQSKIGFAVEVATDLRSLSSPTPEALELLDRIDPLNLRAMDFPSSRQLQLDAIAEIFRKEVAMIGQM